MRANPVFQDNNNLIDNSETVYISSLALLKMLRHGRAGVPMEVMGLMLGEFVDDFTVRVVDVFAMPQSGTGVSVEAVDPVFQMKMMDMLRQTGRYGILSAPAPFFLLFGSRQRADWYMTGPNQWLVGTTPTPGLAAGFPRLTSTPNRALSSLRLAPLPS